jgi:hypothetical protein
VAALTLGKTEEKNQRGWRGTAKFIKTENCLNYHSQV